MVAGSSPARGANYPIGIASQAIRVGDMVRFDEKGYLAPAITGVDWGKGDDQTAYVCFLPRPLPKQRIFYRDGEWWIDTDPASARYDPKDIFRPSVKGITWSYLPYIRSGPRPRKSTTL